MSSRAFKFEDFIIVLSSSLEEWAIEDEERFLYLVISDIYNSKIVFSSVLTRFRIIYDWGRNLLIYCFPGKPKDDDEAFFLQDEIILFRKAYNGFKAVIQKIIKEVGL